MMTRPLFVRAVVGLIALAVPVGCDKKPEHPVEARAAVPTDPAKPGTPANDEVAAVRAKLDPADRALVEAQEWCAISTDEPLGAMGAPIKVELKGQPVFLCCKSCKRKAEADPDATLAKVAELKAKKLQEKK